MRAWAWCVVLAACNYPKLAKLDGSAHGPPDAAPDAIDSGTSAGSAAAVAWYRMNDAANASACADASGTGNDAQLVGTQFDFEAGWAGGALRTSGASGHASAPASASLAVTRVTVEAWVMPNAIPISQSAVAKGSDYVLGFDSGGHASFSLVLASGATVSVVSVSTIAMATWTHLAATWDGSTASIYVNGGFEQAATPTAGGPLRTSSAALDLGATFPGLLDEVRVFGAARSATQILDDATYIAHWKLDESSGSVAHDSSGNMRDLQVTGATWGAGKVGNALVCDGATTSATMASDPGLRSTGPTTIEVWVNGPAQNGTTSSNVIAGRLSSSGASAGYAYAIMRCCGRSTSLIDFLANIPGVSGTSIAPDPSPAPLDSTWHHIVGTFNGSLLCAYYDGGYLGCYGQSYAALAGTAGAFFLCSADANTSYYQGRVDEVRVYSRLLTASEVRSHFDDPTAPSGAP